MKLKKGFIIAVLLACSFPKLFAQSKGEVDMLKALNPVNKSNANFKTLSQTTQPLAIAIPFGLLAVSLINDNKKGELNAYEIAGSIAVATVASEGIKLLIKRPRPYQKYDDIYPDEIDNGSSFPSNHTSVAFATATSLALVYKKWYISTPAFLWAASVGYSRLYLGQHYPSDVFAGAIVGAGSAYASRWLNKKLFGKKNKIVSF